MESPLIYAFIATLLVSVVSLIGIAALSVTERALRGAMYIFVGLAAGALLGDAFIHLIPEAFEGGIEETVFAASILTGIIIFLLLEKYLRWHSRNMGHKNCLPGEDCVVNTKKPLGALVLFGDGVHNFVDGTLIAASFSLSLPLGIATTIAVFLHEVPQEITDFALLLHAGFSRAEALFWNLMSGLVALLGMFAFFLVKDSVSNIESVAAAFTAGGFIYIAAAHLVPELQKTEHPGRSAVEFIAVLIGIGLMFALTALE